MSAGLGLGVVGAVAGAVIPGVGPLVGYAIGSAIGGALFGPKLPNQQGPRLQDLSIQSSAEGQPVFKIYGTMRTAGNVFWGKPLAEHKKKKKSGGKGGGGGQTTTTYTYTVDFAVGLCEGPITGIVKLWADGKLFYDVSALTAAEEAIVAGGGYLPDATARFQASFGKTINIADTSGTMRIYPGSETQMPDPLIEADLGVGNTPAYRGEAYIVFDNFALKDYGNRIPNITAEVIANGSSGYQYLGKIAIPRTPQPASAQDYNTQVNYITAAKIVALGYWDDIGYTYPSEAAFKQTPIEIYPSGITILGADVIADADYAPTNGHTSSLAYLESPGLAMGYDTGVGEGNDPSHWRYSLIGGTMATVSVLATFKYGTGAPIDYDLPAHPSAVFQIGDDLWVYWRRGMTLYHQSISLINPTATIQAQEESYALSSHVPSANYENVYSVFAAAGKFFMLITGSPNDRLLTFDLATMTLLEDVAVPYSGTFKGKLFVTSDGIVYVITGDTVVNGGRLYSYSGGAWEYLALLTGAGLSEGYIRSSNSDSETWAVDGGMVIMNIGENIHYWAKGVSGEAVTLSSIVSDVCASAGLDSSLINVTDLASTQVRGYIRNAQMTARAALEPLAAGFFFDATESDGKIVFRKRGGATVATIDYDDLGAANPGAQEDRLVTTITQDNELPIELNLRYADPARDFQTGSQRSRRQIPASKKIDTIDMPISWSGTEAKQAVEKLHYSAWEAQTRYQFALPIKYMRLEPGDPILLPVNGVNKRVRLTKTVLLGSVIQCEAESDYAASYISEAVAADNPAGPQVIKVPGTTIMHLLDIPILQDADNDAGLYIAATGTGSGWTGAAIMKSADGVAFDEVDAITTESVIGSTSTLLPSGPTTIWDDGSIVGVRLIKDTLTSTTDLATLAGANTAAIGAPGRWEIVSFATATLNADGTYTLSRLLRGRLGTEWAVGLHAIGDAFVLLEAGVLARNVPATADIGVPRYYKAVSFGGDDGDMVTYTHQAVGLECYAPTHIRGLRHSPSTNDWAITWTRRSRVDGAWRDYVDVPVGEAAQSYEVDIMSGSTVKRTIAASSESATYTAAMQTTDFGSAQSTITVNIYQLSATVGRGYVGTKTL